MFWKAILQTFILINTKKKKKINSNNNLPLEKERIMHNVMIPIISVFNENHNRYCDKLFFGKILIQMI